MSSVTTYLDGPTRRIYAFSTPREQRLAVTAWDGAAWCRYDLGTPPIPGELESPAVIAYLEDYPWRIHAFVTVATHLYVSYWDGSRWQWADLGAPPGSGVYRPAGVIAYGQDGTQRLYSFVEGESNRLFVSYWDGTQWRWAEPGD